MLLAGTQSGISQLKVRFKSSLRPYYSIRAKHASLLQALALDGRCKSFDASADGYGRGEGCLVAYMRRQDGVAGAPRGILHSTAVNQDGRSSSLTAPHGPSQYELINLALERSGKLPCLHVCLNKSRTAVLTACDLFAGMLPDQVGLFTMHGTGTPLGDPIETTALGQVLSHSKRTMVVTVSAPKSHCGHSEGAAGLAGMAFAILSLEHRVNMLCNGLTKAMITETSLTINLQILAPILHLRNVNHYVGETFNAWQRVKVAMLREQSPHILGHDQWFAGSSSFGMSGVNAHAILASSGQTSSNIACDHLSLMRKTRCWCLVPLFWGTAKVELLDERYVFHSDLSNVCPTKFGQYEVTWGEYSYSASVQ